jgi:uncharacterized delta-60 repeat protein
MCLRRAWIGAVLTLAPAWGGEGDPDSTFGAAGRTTVSRSAYGSPAEAWAVALQPDGKIVAAGRFGLQVAVVRLLASGALDPSFDGDGVKAINLGNQAVARGVAVQPDGKIVLAGRLNAADGTYSGLLIRLLPDGQADPSFGPSGNGVASFNYVNTSYCPNNVCSVQLNAVTLRSDGRIVAAGYANFSPRIYNYQQFIVGQFLAGGTLDPGFGSGGWVGATMGTSCSYSGSQAHAVALQPDGKILAGGFGCIGCPARLVFGLARFAASGAFDPSFDGNGILTGPTSSSASRDGFDGVRALAIQADGSILAAGVIESTVAPLRKMFAIARYSSSGAPDPLFGANGVFTASPPTPYQHAYAFGMAVQPDGKILLAGEADTANPGSGGWDAALARVTREGTLDPSFGSGGWSIAPTPGLERLNAIALQADGRIVVAGLVGSEILVARYLGAATGPVFGVSRVHPTQGGQQGSVTLRVEGQLFQPGASVLLRRPGAPDIPAQGVSVAPGGQSLSAQFEFAGATLGAWDVVVVNPGGSTASKPSGFTIAPTSSARGVATISMASRRRAGITYQAHLNWANLGNVDGLIPITIRIVSSEGGVRFNFKPYHGALRPEFEPFPDDLPWRLDSVDANGRVVTASVLVISAAAGSQGSLSFDVSDCGAVIEVASGPAMTWECTRAINEAILGLMLGDCASVAFDLTKKAARGILGETMSLATVVDDSLKLSVAKCLLNFIPAGKVKKVLDAILKGLSFLEALDQVKGMFEACGILKFNGGGAAGECVASRDPNDKYGPPGGGTARFIQSTGILPYAIAFENVAAATAPAQEVVVTDVLSSAAMDLDSFALGLIAIGGKTLVPPPGLKAFTGDLDLRPQVNMIARVEAALDPATGVARWRFRSIDPATGQPTTDPLAGFLPPNTSPPLGEGTVLFSVRPRAGLATGTAIQNQASIVFDTNAPILTPVWSNTLDDTKPASAVAPLAPKQMAVSFPVSWNGTDTGSGVARYIVYASENGGPFTPWLPSTTATQAVFTGVRGNTYAFYSIAVDAAGNVEDANSGGDAQTLVVLDTTPPSIVPTVAGPMGSNGWYTGAVTVSWSVADPESGIASSSGCDPLQVTQDTPGRTLTCSATNGVGLSASVPVTIKVDRSSPAFTGMPAASCSIWPVNKKMVQVAVVSASDGGAGLASFNVTGTSNEPSNPKDPDIVITGTGLLPRTVQLRADRLGSGSGRVYTLLATATDLAGNTASATAQCRVPHDQGRMR